MELRLEPRDLGTTNSSDSEDQGHNSVIARDRPDQNRSPICISLPAVQVRGEVAYLIDILKTTRRFLNFYWNPNVVEWADELGESDLFKKALFFLFNPWKGCGSFRWVRVLRNRLFPGFAPSNRPNGRRLTERRTEDG
jgi:hypothetical protein